MKVRKGRYELERDYVAFRDRDGDDVRVSSGALDTGAEVLGIEGMSPIYLTKHHLRRLMPHFQAWLETDSLKLPEEEGTST